VKPFVTVFAASETGVCSNPSGNCPIFSRRAHRLRLFFLETFGLAKELSLFVDLEAQFGWWKIAGYYPAPVDAFAIFDATAAAGWLLNSPIGEVIFPHQRFSPLPLRVAPERGGLRAPPEPEAFLLSLLFAGERRPVQY